MKFLWTATGAGFPLQFTDLADAAPLRDYENQRDRKRIHFTVLSEVSDVWVIWFCQHFSHCKHNKHSFITDVPHWLRNNQSNNNHVWKSKLRRSPLINNYIHIQISFLSSSGGNGLGNIIPIMHTLFYSTDLIEIFLMEITLLEQRPSSPVANEHREKGIREEHSCSTATRTRT